MNRHATPTVLSSYLDEQVSAEEARWIEEHLGACGECRERLEGLRRVVRGLRDLEPVKPPPGLGLELQRHLARATPPFAERGPLDARSSRSVMQPVILASLGVVLALAVIMLLFLQALQGRSGNEGVVAPKTSPEISGQAEVVVGERSFRRTPMGWIETSLTVAEIAAARQVTRREIRGAEAADVDRLLDELTGELTLRVDGEVLRVRD